jgi:hypothetical protein
MKPKVNASFQQESSTTRKNIFNEIRHDERFSPRSRTRGFYTSWSRALKIEAKSQDNADMLDPSYNCDKINVFYAKLVLSSGRKIFSVPS